MSRRQKKTYKPRPTRRQRAIAAAKSAAKIQATIRLHRGCEAVSGDPGHFEREVGVGKGILGQKDELAMGQKKGVELEDQGLDCGVVGDGGGGEGGGSVQARTDGNKLRESQYGKTVNFSDDGGGKPQISEPNNFVKEVTVVKFEDDGSRSKIKYEFVS